MMDFVSTGSLVGEKLKLIMNVHGCRYKRKCECNRDVTLRVLKDWRPSTCYRRSYFYFPALSWNAIMFFFIY